jgi:predicted Rossmann-fold nucleotide-binding protein
MLRHLDHMVVEGFLRKENRLSLMAAESIESLLEAMSAYDSSPEIPKWL